MTKNYKAIRAACEENSRISRIVTDEFLIGFNGMCWQSYGPIGAYKGFEPDDIFFFAAELRPDIEDETDIMEDIENNPIPYLMLLCGANYPLIFHRKDQVVQVISEFDLEKINTAEIRQRFKMEYKLKS